MAGNPSPTTNDMKASDMKASQRPRVRVVRASGDDQTERVHRTTEPRCNDEPSMNDANLTIQFPAQIENAPSAGLTNVGISSRGFQMDHAAWSETLTGINYE